ncbi:MAG TPA: hypothetical protein VLC10_04820 [Patescibacteria group bacterium]|nr:hypothetical protein [Patescibacteria group bacterium]
MNYRIRKTSVAQRGATLLELVLYVGLVGLALSAGTMFAWEFSLSRAKSAAYAEVVHNARFAVSRMEAEIREASAINVGASVFDSNPGTLSLAATVVGANPTVFAVSSGALTVQQGAGAPVALTNSRVAVSEFVVEDVSSGTRTRAVRIRLSLASKGGTDLTEQRAQATVETTVRIRLKDGFSN